MISLSVEKNTRPAVEDIDTWFMMLTSRSGDIDVGASNRVFVTVCLKPSYAPSIDRYCKNIFAELENVSGLFGQIF